MTTAEEIKEAGEALVKLGLEIARRGMDAEFNEEQIVFANAKVGQAAESLFIRS